jgi:hypothetical protein
MPQQHTHLELSHRKAFAKTRPRTIHERQQMSMSLDLLCFLWDPILLEPSFGLPDFRIRSPDRSRAINTSDIDQDESIFGDRDVVDDLARLGAYGLRKGDYIVFSCLRVN